MENKQIIVIGAGTMGNGIAHVFALNGYDVSLVEVNHFALDKAIATIGKNLDRMIKKGKLSEEEKATTQGRIRPLYSLEEAPLDTALLVIEAATENEKIKLEIFTRLDAQCGENTILASNTSSISITKIASATKRPDKVIGMHFFNPVPVMQLVEIIRGYGTSDATMATIVDLAKHLNKVPVEVNDYPGFISNRVLMPMINEAICSLYEGIAGVEQIDTVMKLGMAHPMGPLQLADFIGLDVCLAIMRVLQNGFGNPKYAPCPLLVNMVQAGKLGRKTGEGFYQYTKGSKEIKVSKQFT